MIYLTSTPVGLTQGHRDVSGFARNADLVGAEGLAARALQSRRMSRYARSPDCSSDRGLARYAAFMPPGVWSLAGEGVNHQSCWQAGRMSHDRPCPGGLSWFTRIPGQRPAIPRARGAGHASRRGTGQHDRPVRHGARHRACGGRLRGIAERVAACCGAGLRGKRVHAQGPEGPALSGQRPPMPISE